MKKITVYLIVAMITISIDCLGQDNKYLKSFVIADSVFNSIIDQKLFTEIDSTISNSKEKTRIPLSEEHFLLICWSAYINGSMSALKKGSIDLHQLKKEIMANKKAFKSYASFLLLHNKKP